MEAFAAATKKISGIYLASGELETKGISVYSTDEKAGIQAREHKNPKILLTKEHPERIDPEYICHGTTGLIASWNVATREAFLSDTSHKVYFVFTPKHCSWLNQIECWFGIITRRL